MTCFVTAVGLSVHGETPFAVECGAGLPVGRKIGTVAPPIAPVEWRGHSRRFIAGKS